MQEVFGELYEVDDKLLEHLDWLESHPEVYTRTPTQCIMLDTQTLVNCEVYIVSNFKPHLLSLPHHSSYSDALDEGSKYRSRDGREENDSIAKELKQ